LALLVQDRYLPPLVTTSLSPSVELLFSSALAADVIQLSFTPGKISQVNSELLLKLFNPSEWSQRSLADRQ